LKFHLTQAKKIVRVVYTTGIYKKNVNNKAVYTPLPRIGTKEVNANTKVVNTPGIRKDLILVGTFQDYMNKIVGEDTSHEKDSNASIKIIKPPPIVG
jgi:hypothetical protein